MDDFTAKIIRGQTPPSTPHDIETLIEWVSTLSNRANETINVDGQNVPAGIASRLALVFLDHAILSRESEPYRVLGLVPGTQKEEVRARYRRLLRIYHPDRHPDDQEWFTACTEKINRAYALLKKENGRSGFDDFVSPRAESYNERSDHNPKTSSSTNGRNPEFYYSREAEIRSKLQSAFGNARKLKTRVYMALIIIPLLVIWLVYQNNKVITEQAAIKNFGSSIPTEKITESQLDVQMPARTIVEENDSRAALEHELDEKVPEPGRSVRPLPGLPTLDQLPTSEHNVANNKPRHSQVGTDSSLEEYDNEPSAPSEIVRLEPNETESIERLEKTVVASIEKKESSVVERAQGALEVDEPQPATPRIVASTPVSSPPSAKRKDVTVSAPKNPAVAISSLKHSKTQGKKTLKDLIGERTAVKKLLEEFQVAYNNSDISRLMDLFHDTATMRNGGNKSEIKRHYIGELNASVARDLRFSEFKVQSLGRNQYKIEATYFLVEEQEFPKGFKRQAAGTYNLHTLEIKDELKIWRLD